VLLSHNVYYQYNIYINLYIIIFYIKVYARRLNGKNNIIRIRMKKAILGQSFTTSTSIDTFFCFVFLIAWPQ